MLQPLRRAGPAACEGRARTAAWPARWARRSGTRAPRRACWRRKVDVTLEEGMRLRGAARRRRRARGDLPPARRAGRARALQLPAAPAQRPPGSGAGHGQLRGLQAERADARRSGERLVALLREAGASRGRPRGRARGARHGQRAGAATPTSMALLFTGSWAAGARAQRGHPRPARQAARARDGRQQCRCSCSRTRTSTSLAVAETALSVAATTGQRCTCAGRRIFVQRPVFDAFSEKLAARAGRALRSGRHWRTGVFMGPLVSQARARGARGALARDSRRGGRRAHPARGARACRRPTRARDLVRFEDRPSRRTPTSETRSSGRRRRSTR